MDMKYLDLQGDKKMRKYLGYDERFQLMFGKGKPTLQLATKYHQEAIYSLRPCKF